ncbi:toprim domain-containing protein [Streptomyces sp. NPDC004732]|uniref:toprim domain-containing protein n=1 Tax=Streptomyces sp. NPDC004732 TaxID=3154290 RepID=UPI0033B8863C
MSLKFQGSPAEEYLASARHLDTELLADRFRLGFVDDSAPSGFERYMGRLAVPYLRRNPFGKTTVAAIRFRCVRAECIKNPDGSWRDEEAHVGHGKMESMPGDTHRVYNAEAILRAHDEIAICEGEPDTWTAEMCGIPAVGIQGVNGWKDYFTELFLGYRTVYVLADGDKAGEEFATEVAKKLPNALVVPMGQGLDVNKLHTTKGREAVLEKVGR